MHSQIKHVAIIMDGNRRWAKLRNLPVLAGHKKVLDDVLESLIEHATKKGIKYITLWAWSTENWKRDEKEVMGIMNLFKNVITSKGKRLHEKGVRVKIIGDISRFEKQIQESLINLMELTKNNKNITAIFALNYGGRDEILRAIYKLRKNLQPTTYNLQLTEQIFAQFLDTSGIPDPDIIIRTGGERRLSGFLLWQCAYSELYFMDWFMPEFTTEKLNEILIDFVNRQRRFGK